MSRHPKEARLRQRIACEAARILTDGHCHDIRTARRKAADWLAADRRTALPTEAEIEQALKTRQALFQQRRQPQIVAKRRRQALAAMQALEPFNPRLTGPVLAGTAEPDNRIELLLFSATAEEVFFSLLDQRIPWREHEKTLCFKGGAKRRYPACCFRAGDAEIELTLLPLEARRQQILGPLGDRPLQQASLRQLQGLVEAD